MSPSEDVAPLKGLLARAGQGQESWTLPAPSETLGPTPSHRARADTV